MKRTLKALTRVLTAILILFAATGIAGAQTYPVLVNTQVSPPYSPFLSDYTAPGMQRLMVNFVLRDPTIPEYSCKLRLTIEGVGITIRTKPGFAPQPLVLPGGGIPLQLYGEDLAEYFLPANLDFAGITRSQYEKGARLPDGVYRFTIEVLDYNRGTAVSNKGTAMAWIILNDPPLLNMPRNETKVTIIDPANIAFNWTPRHTASPNSAFTAEYIFRLVEIWPITRNPYDAMLSQQPLYEETTGITQLVYTMAGPALIPGRKYAWQVQAKDTDGRDLFKNQGKSEVYVFQYGDALGAPEGLYLQTANPTSLVVRWEQNVAGTDAVKYRVRYRPHNNRTQEAWYEDQTEDQWRTLSSLQPATEYEVQVRAEQSVQVSEYAAVKVFKTAEQGANEFVCKSDVGPPPAPIGSGPAFRLGVNDTIHAGGYDVLVRELTANANGIYTGSGMAIVPWFNSAKVKVTFKNIGVNEQHWLTSGEIKSVWNANSKFLLKPEPKPNTPGNTPNSGPVPVTEAETKTLIEITGAAIATVTKNEDGDIEIATTDGETQVLEKGQSYSIVDEVGNGYVVDKDGNITKTTADVARGAAERGDRNYTIALRFEKGDGKLGFDAKKYDALAQYYQQLEGNGEYIAWKAVTSKPDPVAAVLEGTGIDPKKVRFQVNGVPLSVAPNGNTYRLDVLGKAEGTVEELLALYKPADTAKDNVLGKLNLVSYDMIRRSVVIVPVNKATLPGGLDPGALSDALTKIYGQAAAGWDVTVAPKPLEITLNEKFDDGESGLLTNYTDDMKKVINAYGTLLEKTYYLFLVGEPRSGSDATGYMPRSKQAGFIFTGNLTSTNAIRTLAHELGHGAFNLQHSFKECPALGERSSDNLMDYGNGTTLCKFQWDHVHDPQRVLSLFESDEDSEEISFQLAELTDDYKNQGAYTFLTPSGKIITLPADTKTVALSTADPMYYVSTGALADNIGPVGGLFWFVKGKNKDMYTLRANSSGVGYWCEAKKEFYKDELSTTLTVDKALIGLPFYENKELGFEVYKVPVTDAMKLPQAVDQFPPMSNVFTVVDVMYGDTNQNIADVNNQLSSSGYFRLFDLSGATEERKSIKFKDHTGFSAVGQAYLSRNALLSAKGNPLAPIIVANAYWITEMKGNELTEICAVSSQTSELDKVRQFIQWMEEDVWDQNLTREQGEASKSIWARNLYYDFRAKISTMNLSRKQTTNANTVIAAMDTKAGEQLKTVIRPLTPCELENLTIENRIKAIDMLEPMSGEEAEELIVKLIESAVYNAQSKQLTRRIFKNKGKLHFRLDNRLDGAELAKYYNKVSEFMRLDNDGNTFKEQISLSEVGTAPNGKVYTDCNFYASIDPTKGQITITKSYYSGGEFDQAVIIFSKTYSLTDSLEVLFPKEDAFMDLYEETRNNDDRLIMPAFYLAHLIQEKIKKDSFKCIRFIGNGIAILLALPSGGQSLTAAGAITIALAGADIVMTIIEDDLKKTETGRAIILVWDDIQWLDAGAGLAQLGKVATRVITKTGKTVITITLTIPEMLAAVRSGQLNNKVIDAIRTTAFKLVVMQQSTMAAILNTKLLKQIDFAQIQSKFRGLKQDLKLVSDDWVECSVEVNGSKSRLFDLSGSSTEAFVKGEFQNAKELTDEVVGEFTEIKYLDDASSTIKTQKAKVRYNAATKQAYLSKWSLLSQDVATGKVLYNNLDVGVVASGKFTIKEGVSALGATVDDVIDLKGVTTVVEDGIEYEVKSAKITAKEGKWICEAEGGYCFVAGTPVHVGGKTVAIETIRANSQVVAFDHTTNRSVMSRVSNTFKRTVNKLAKVVIGGALVLSTIDHPFYANGHYTPAKELHAGDSVLTLAGKKEVVNAISLVDTTAVVYNLEVADYHNYYVGYSAWLVHNSCALKTIYSRITDHAKRTAFKSQVRLIGGTAKERSALIERIAGLPEAELTRFMADFTAGTPEFAKIFLTNTRALDAYTLLKNGMPQYARSVTDVVDLAKDLAKYDASFGRLIASNEDALALWDLARQDAKGAAAFLDDLADEERLVFEPLFKHEKFVQNVLPWMTKGKDFEKALNLMARDGTSTFWKKIAEKLGIKPDEFKLDDYEVFEQVQLKTGNTVDAKGNIYKPGAVVPTGTTVKDEYFIADFVLVKKDVSGPVVTLDFDNVIIVESKLSETTAMTTRQGSGLGATKSGGKLSCRNDTPRESILAGKTDAIVKGVNLGVHDWIKVWSDGAGGLGDMKSLMK